jgi:transglutaminase-like putative cysteine protease
MTGVSNTSSSTSLVFLPGAEAALVGLSVATVIGFFRVFDEPDFLVPMLAVALAAHLVMLVSRRRGWSVPVTTALSAPVAALVCVWLLFPDTTSSGLPTMATSTEIVDAMRDAWRQFGSILAPAPPERGFVLASCVALYFAVLLADWAAFRLWSSFEAIVPATTLFLFCALLGTGPQVASAALFIAALLLFLLLHRIARQESSSGWLTSERPDAGARQPVRSGRHGPIILGTALVATAVLAGTIVGPRLPGAGSPAVVPWRHNAQSPGERKELSPLVNLRDRLLKQTDSPLFTVEADEPSYWRLTSLDVFDGDMWRSQAQFEEVEDELPGEVGAGETDDVRQRFTIENLDKIWAPVAFKPVRLKESTVPLSYNEDLSTLILKENDDTLRGAAYVAESRTIQPSSEMLRGVTTDDVPDEVRERYTGLPEDFSEVAKSTAASLVGTSDRPYDMAMKLQRFFRNGNFQYDTTLEGHSESAIDAFLRDKRGFCEQFAGTYAAMARSLGLPARVAVGFTQGVVRNPDAPNVYHVTGRQSHAWPEVHLGKYGWVMFEPTPGRGAPNADWTGLQQDQDEGSALVTNPSVGTIPPVTLGIDPPPPTTEPPPTTTTLDQRTEEPTTESRRGWMSDVLVLVVPVLLGLAVLALGLMGVLLLYVLALSALLDRRRRERRAWATDPSRRVLVSWEECVDELRTLGLVPLSSESHDEFAARVAPRLGDAGPDLIALADAANQADYAPGLLEDTFAENAVQRAETTTSTVGLLRTPAQHWLTRVDFRPLINDGRRRPHHTISVQNPT